MPFKGAHLSQSLQQKHNIRADRTRRWRRWVAVCCSSLIIWILSQKYSNVQGLRAVAALGAEPWCMTVLKKEQEDITTRRRQEAHSRGESTRIKNIAHSTEKYVNTMEILVNLSRSVVLDTQ